MILRQWGARIYRKKCVHAHLSVDFINLLIYLFGGGGSKSSPHPPPLLPSALCIRLICTYGIVRCIGSLPSLWSPEVDANVKIPLALSPRRGLDLPSIVWSSLMAVTNYLSLKHWQQSQNVKPNRPRRRLRWDSRVLQSCRVFASHTNDVTRI